MRRGRIFEPLIALVLVLVGPATVASQTAAYRVEVGSGAVATSKQTSAGTPVFSMWSARAPTTSRRTGTGFPVLTEAEHFSVWEPEQREDGAYNHYAALTVFEGRFHAMWGNHPLGEDGPGQRVLYAVSDDAKTWSTAVELFPAPGPVQPRGTRGIHLKPDRWVQVQGRLYAVAYVHGAGLYPIAREVSPEGKFGEPFKLRELPTGGRLPAFMAHAPDNPSLDAAHAILAWYAGTGTVSWWAQHGEGLPKTGVDGANLIEPFAYRTRDDTPVAMFRSFPTRASHARHNNRIYVSFFDRAGQWSTPHPTDIPDSPSRATAVTLPSRGVLLVGNQTAHVLDQALYLDRDPLTVSISEDGYTFARTYALRADAPARHRFPGVRGRNLGFAYPSALIHDGWLYVLYSIGKEDMGLSRVPLHALNLPH